MGMAAQEQIEPGMRSLPVNFRRVRQENSESVLWDLLRGLFDVVDPIIMRVVDAGQVDALIA